MFLFLLKSQSQFPRPLIGSFRITKANHFSVIVLVNLSMACDSMASLHISLSRISQLLLLGSCSPLTPEGSLGSTRLSLAELTHTLSFCLDQCACDLVLTAL